MSDYLIDEYNAKVHASLAKKDAAVVAAMQAWITETAEAAIELTTSLAHRNRVYVEGPPTPTVRTVEHRPFVIDSDEGAGAEPETPADGDETAPGNAGETKQENQQAA